MCKLILRSVIEHSLRSTCSAVNSQIDYLGFQRKLCQSPDDVTDIRIRLMPDRTLEYFIYLLPLMLYVKWK